MSSWADEANGNESVDQENFKAERIISQTPDGREKVLFSANCAFSLTPSLLTKARERRDDDALQTRWAAASAGHTVAPDYIVGLLLSLCLRLICLLRRPRS